MIPPQTHTYVTLEISQVAFDEIKAKLEAADYQHTFMAAGEIDMQGLALTRDPKSEEEKFFDEYAKVRDVLLTAR